MTWLRWDTETSRSAVVALLAADLGIHLMQATGHYFAAVSGFGDHQPDGNLDAVPDLSLEQWAGWTGKRGRFAAAFRARCRATGEGEDPEGSIRGWWRQRALLEKRERDATRRKPALVKRETPAEPARYVNTSRSVPLGGKGGAGENPRAARLREKIPEVAREAFDGLLRAAPNPAAFVGEVGMLLEDVHGATWDHVGIALRDLALGGSRPTGLALRTFVQKAMETPSNGIKLPSAPVDEYDRAVAKMKAEGR